MFASENNVVRDACFFASAAHAAINQRRKWTDEPYIVHPKAVATTVLAHGGELNTVAAAWLHDVVEDTGVTEELLRQHFNGRIVDLVMMVTDVSKPEDGNRKVRKAKDLEHLMKASPEAWLIKLADFQDNTRTIVEHDPKFAKLYFSEKLQALEAMKHIELNPMGRALSDAVWKQVTDFLASKPA